MSSKRGHQYGPKGARIQTCQLCGVQRWSNKDNFPVVYHLPHGAYGKPQYAVLGISKEPPCSPKAIRREK